MIGETSLRCRRARLHAGAVALAVAVACGGEGGEHAEEGDDAPYGAAYRAFLDSAFVRAIEDDLDEEAFHAGLPFERMREIVRRTDRGAGDARARRLYATVLGLEGAPSVAAFRRRFEALVVEDPFDPGSGCAACPAEDKALRWLLVRVALAVADSVTAERDRRGVKSDAGWNSIVFDEIAPALDRGGGGRTEDDRRTIEWEWVLARERRPFW